MRQHRRGPPTRPGRPTSTTRPTSGCGPPRSLPFRFGIALTPFVLAFACFLVFVDETFNKLFDATRDDQLMATFLISVMMVLHGVPAIRIASGIRKLLRVGGHIHRSSDGSVR